MYDRKNEANEFTGDSVREATANAARFFGLEESELKVVVAEPGSIYGAAARTVVVAFPKDRKPAPTRSGGDRGERSDRGGRERGGRSRERNDRGGDRGGRGRGRRDGGDRPRGEEAEALPSARVEAVESKGKAVGDLAEAGQFLLGALERMSLGDFEISEAVEGDFTVYQVRGPASVALGGGDGRAVDALQLLANGAAKQATDEDIRIVVDVEGDGEDREDSLTRLADRAASRALETKRSVALDPMNPRDRRIVHVALRDRDKIATMSIGDGRYRQVVVVPEGAPEYEEAQEGSS